MPTKRDIRVLQYQITMKAKVESIILEDKNTNDVNISIMETNGNMQDSMIGNKKGIKRKKKRESHLKEKENKIFDENEEPLNKIMKESTLDDISENNNSSNSFGEEESKDNETKEASKKVHDPIDWKKFIKSLKGDKALEALHYLTHEIEGRDVVAEYLEAHGDALKIIQVLDSAEDKKNTSLACTVFSAVRLVLLKCMSKYPWKDEVNKETCTHLLHSYQSLIHDILTTSVIFRERKIVLSLLAAMATMSIFLANKVLALFNTLSPKCIERLSAHSGFADEKSVRVYYLHVFLAFFSHGRSHLIKMLLDIKSTSIIRSITRGLIYDGATTVRLVLTALEDNIVDSEAIIKTVKIHTFNTHVLNDIVSLYIWQGPKAKNSFKKRKAETEDVIDNESIPSQTKKDQEFIQQNVHRILLQLLTNHKLGVVFQDASFGTSGKICNAHAYSVLKILEKEKYWKCDLVQKLIAKTLEACPDLVSPVLNLLVRTFEPTPSGSWLKSIQFLRQVIDNFNEEICQSKTINIKQMSNAVTSTVFSTPVCSVLATEDCLAHPHPTVRLQGIAILLCCFNKVKHLTSVVKQSYSDAPQCVNNFKNFTVNFITKNIKSMPLLVKAFQSGLEGEVYGVAAPAAVDYYMELVDLFLVYYEINPKSIQNEPELVNLLTSFITADICPENDDKVDLLNIKLIKLMFLLNPTQFTLAEFGEMVEKLVHLLGKHPMARSVLQDILASSYLFNGNIWEVNIWVHCFAMESVNMSVIRLFLDSLNKTVENASEIVQMLSDAKDIATKNVHSEKNELDWEELVQLSKNSEKQQSQNVKPLSYFSVSPLVPAFIIALEQSEYPCKDVENFAVNLFIHLLHNQSSPEVFYSLIKDSKVKALKYIKKYVSEWASDWGENSSWNKMLGKFLSLLHLDSPEYKICKALYEPELEEFLTKAIVDLNSDSIMLLFNLVIFHVSQLTVKGCATTEIMERAISIIENLLCSLTSKYENNIFYIQSVLLHPVLVDKFLPLNQGCSNNLTHIVLTILKSCDLRNEKENCRILYKHRLIEQIKQALVGNKKGTKFKPHHFNGTENLMAALEVISIPVEEAHSILKDILTTENNKSKAWLDVAAYMLITISKSSMCLSADLVKKLPEHACLHDASALYLTRFPHQIPLIKTDSLVTEQKNLSKLTELVLNFDIDGTMLMKLLNNNKHNPGVMIPALAAASCCLRFKSSNYQIIHHHTDMIQEALGTNPHPDWLSQHSSFIGTLIKDQKNLECLNKLRDFFVQQWKTLGITETLLNIAEPVFAKKEQQATLVKMLLPTLILSTTPDKFDSCEKLCSHIQKYVQTHQHNNDWLCINKSNEWEEWCKLALKYGEDPDLKAPFLLSTLSCLCSVVYSTDNMTKLDDLLEMIFSHSQFLNAMIWKTQTKYELLQLIFKLITLKPSLSHSNHVPIYLSAYNASLSENDQIIMQLLQLYEKNGVGLSNWKPYFWGEAAITFYSLRDKAAPSLHHSANSIEVFSLFNQKMIESTITRFSINRSLEADTVAESDKSVYDPAFFLPLLTELFASHKHIKNIRIVTDSGALAITISALSSKNKLVRSAAYLVIARFYHHLLSNNDSLCLQLVESLFKGVRSLNQDLPQLSTITTTFLAKTQLVLTDPAHPMYKALGRFIIVKPEFNFTSIPEWNRLFRSTEVEHKIHQEWILDVLKNSIRQEKDIGLVISNNIITILMDYYSSILSDKKTKLLILEIILAVFKASKYSEKNKSLCHTLVLQNGLSSWLSHIIYSPHLNQLLITPLISLLSIVNTHIRHPLLTFNLVLHLFTTAPNKEQIIDLLQIVDSLPMSGLSLAAVKTLCQFVKTNCSDICTKQCCDILEFGSGYQKNVSEQDDVLRLLKSVVIKYVKNNVEKQQKINTDKNKIVYKVKVKSKNRKVVKRNNKTKVKKIKK